MIDLQNIDWNNYLDIAILVSSVIIFLIFIAFTYAFLSGNRMLDLKFRSLGEAAEKLSRLKALYDQKQLELNRISKQVEYLNQEIFNLNANKQSLLPVQEEITKLTAQYEKARTDLLDIEKELVKSKALKEFVDNHKGEEINQLDKMIEEKKAELEQINGELDSGKINDTFNKLMDSVQSNALQQFADANKKAEFSKLDSQIKEKKAELDKLKGWLDNSKINENFNRLMESVQSNALQKFADNNQKAEFNKLESQIREKKNELNRINGELTQGKINNTFNELLGQLQNNVSNGINGSIAEAIKKIDSQLCELNKTQDLKNNLLQDVQELKNQRMLLDQEVRKLNAQKGSTSGKDAEIDDSAYRDLEDDWTYRNFCHQRTQEFLGKESEALLQFRNYLKSQKIHYSPRTIAAFHTSLKVQNVNPISVLAGLSGTGKTLLAMKYAAFFNFCSVPVAVQPRWDSKDDLLGFYNFLEKRYQPTELIKALYFFDKLQKDINNELRVQRKPMLMVILDEMNLARVEYYFSEFLSKLEMREIDRQKSTIQIGLSGNARSFNVGRNVVFVGTMNDDESTYSLSDKVLDRSNVIHFGAPGKFTGAIDHLERQEPVYVSARQFNQWCTKDNFAILGSSSQDNINEYINTINQALDEVGKAFGYRVNNAITQYIRLYSEINNSNDNDKLMLALADQIEMKIIPKLAGLEQNDASTKCIDGISSVIDATRDEDLIEAFTKARENFNQNGMFIWHGVTRAAE